MSTKIQFFASRKQELKSKYVPLTKHEQESNSSIYYTYVLNNKEYKYTNTYISKIGTTYIGKTIQNNDVILTYHEGVEHIDCIPAHFTYTDADGNDHVYTGEVEFNKDTNTYTATVEDIQYVDEYVQLIEE